VNAFFETAVMAGLVPAMTEISMCLAPNYAALHPGYGILRTERVCSTDVPLEEAGEDVARVPQDADYQERIRLSFAKQGLMRTLGASLCNIAPGLVEIAIHPDPSISQQHGFIHAGALCAIADTAAGYAALSLMPRGSGVLTTEFKINLVAPAVGDRILARGRVVKAGRTLTLAQTEIFGEAGGQEKLVALLTATLMTVEGREGISD
jgi:uncharacterized protein (TIGR00369 family)